MGPCDVIAKTGEVGRGSGGIWPNVIGRHANMATKRETNMRIGGREVHEGKRAETERKSEGKRERLGERERIGKRRRRGRGREKWP